MVKVPNPAPQPGGLLLLAEAAAYARKSVQTIRRAIVANELVGVRSGKSLLVTSDSLLAYVHMTSASSVLGPLGGEVLETAVIGANPVLPPLVQAEPCTPQNPSTALPNKGDNHVC